MVWGGSVDVEMGEIEALVKSRKPVSLELTMLTWTVSPTPIITGA
jgi:hypothetical protein